MGDVIRLLPKAAGQNDTEAALLGLLAQERAGELEGTILIATTEDGTEMHVLGGCAHRLQVAVVALVQGLSFITEKIADSGTAGDTHSDPFRTSWTAPKRRMPRRLREATDFGELE
jgi:hypothetical protein